MIKFLDLHNKNSALRSLKESAEAYACFMFDKSQLANNNVYLDESNFEAIGQARCKFLGTIETGIDIYIKLDAEVDIYELVFETDKRQFCALILKHEFINQDEFEWNRLASYWIGLLANSRILKRGFNQSLISMGLPESSIEWDSAKTHNALKDLSINDRVEQIFENFLPLICDTFSFEFKLNLFKTSDWKFRYWSTCKYGYYLEYREIEIRLLIHLDRLRLSILFKNIEKFWLDLPPEILRNTDESLQSSILDSLRLFRAD